MRVARGIQGRVLRYQTSAISTSQSLPFDRQFRACVRLSGPTAQRSARHLRSLDIATKRFASLARRDSSSMMPGLIQEVTDSDSPAPVPDQIQLDIIEQTLKRLLLDAAHYIEETTGQDAIVLRFTGGWVRDKLLGVPSHDIDVAINNMTGYRFGLLMKEYLDAPGNSEKYELPDVATNKPKVSGSALHKIEANPEKSKHLETVTTRLLGLDVDLVNLRKESYTEDSRNPLMEFGTAEEDALRRDATVNAMFYNLNTGEIEDFTGQGRTDLRSKVLRTPLEPYQTFKDDPLRVLRLIRFASRLGWTIDVDTLAAMRQPDIKDALQRKISRERVGVELEKALRGPDPHEALRLILHTGLYETIFCDPTAGSKAHCRPDLTNAELALDVLQRLLDESTQLGHALTQNNEDNFHAWVMASLIPYRHAPLSEPSEAGRKAPPELAARIAREGIKSTSKTCDLITHAVRNLGELREIVDVFHQHIRRPAESRSAAQDVTARDYLGMKIRTWGPQWRSQLVFALLTDIADQPDNVDAYIRRYTSFVGHLQQLNLFDACQFKPLIDGKALAKTMGLPPGPWMKEALDVVMAWQLRNPGQTDPAAAMEEVKKSGELAFSLAQHFLKLTVRPLFSKSKPSTITHYARSNTTTTARIQRDNNDDTAKPWKNASNSSALHFLTWSTEHLDQQGIRELWPLLVPPVLTLIDDWETQYKRLGCQLLDTVLKRTPTDLLERTGLGAVSEEALMPALTYLPPLLKDEEAISLLPSVFAALIILAETRHSSSDAIGRRGRTDAYDRILRKGVIYGYAHADQYPGVVAILLQNLAILVNKLGVLSVKHLKFTIPMLVEILSSSLVVSQPAILLRNAALCLHAVIRNGWPRMYYYRGDILKAITLCWLNLEDKERKEEESVETMSIQAQLREDLRVCASLVREAVNATTTAADGVDDGPNDAGVSSSNGKESPAFDEDIHLLIAADPRLLPLFEQ